MSTPIRHELAAVEKLIKKLVAEHKAAASAAKREHKDVERLHDASSTRWLTHRSWYGGAAEPDDDRIERERAELAEAEAQLRSAEDLVAIARARADTLRARIARGAHESEDTLTLAHELRDTVATAEAAAAEAQSIAIEAVMGGRHAGTSARLGEARRSLARARVQLGLLIAHLQASRGAAHPIVAGLTAVELKGPGSAATQEFCGQLADHRRRINELIEPLLSATAYR
jgi:chromosome segregation ATPase